MKDLMKELADVEKIVKGFAAQRAPEENKLTTVMAPGVELSCWQVDAGLNTSGDRVVFCVSDHPNVAGYYLGWRETRYAGERAPGRREWVCDKNRDLLIRMAGRRAKQFPDNCKKARQRRIDRKAGKTMAASSPAPAGKDEAVKGKATGKAAPQAKPTVKATVKVKPIPKPKGKPKGKAAPYTEAAKHGL